MKTDQRRFARYSTATPAVLYFHGPSEPQYLRTSDLAEEGAQFRLPDPVPAGLPVLIHLVLRRDIPPLECKGKVCWSSCDDDGHVRFGVRFIDLRDDERDLLSQYLAVI